MLGEKTKMSDRNARVSEKKFIYYPLCYLWKITQAWNIIGHIMVYGNNNLNEDAAQTRKFIETRIVSRSSYEGRFTHSGCLCAPTNYPRANLYLLIKINVESCAKENKTDSAW